MVCFGLVWCRSGRRRRCARRGDFRRPIGEKLRLLHLDLDHREDVPPGLFGVCGGGRSRHTQSFAQRPLFECGGGSDDHAVLVPHLFLCILVILFEADVPGQAAHGRHRLKLVHHTAGDVVDVVVVQLDASVSDALPPQLVELGIIHPLDTLRTSTDIQLNRGHNIRR